VVGIELEASLGINDGRWELTLVGTEDMRVGSIESLLLGMLDGLLLKKLGSHDGALATLGACETLADGSVEPSGVGFGARDPGNTVGGVVRSRGGARKTVVSPNSAHNGMVSQSAASGIG